MVKHLNLFVLIPKKAREINNLWWFNSGNVIGRHDFRSIQDSIIEEKLPTEAEHLRISQS